MTSKTQNTIETIAGTETLLQWAMARMQVAKSYSILENGTEISVEGSWSGAVATLKEWRANGELSDGAEYRIVEITSVESDEGEVMGSSTTRSEIVV